MYQTHRGSAVPSAPTSLQATSREVVYVGLEVISLRERLEVIRIYTKCLAAEMMDLKAFRDRATLLFVDNAMHLAYDSADANCAVGMVGLRFTRSLCAIPDMTRRFVASIFHKNGALLTGRVSSAPFLRLSLYAPVRQAGLRGDGGRVAAAAPTFAVRESGTFCVPLSAIFTNHLFKSFTRSLRSAVSRNVPQRCSMHQELCRVGFGGDSGLLATSTPALTVRNAGGLLFPSISMLLFIHILEYTKVFRVTP